MQDDTIDIHIRSAARPGDETQRLLDHLVGLCWAGATADHTDPVARGWLRHFSCIRPVVYEPGCTCELGNCPSCN